MVMVVGCGQWYLRCIRDVPGNGRGLQGELIGTSSVSVRCDTFPSAGKDHSGEEDGLIV